MPLPREHLLDELATAYVQAVVARAGATIAVARRDYGVDGTIKEIGTTEDGAYFETGYPVEFQLKGATAAARSVEAVKYDLKVRNYNLLAARKETATPYYLFLVCFLPDIEDWLDADDDALTLNASAFWWKHSGTVSENSTSVRVEIPRSNRLTINAIGDMLKLSQSRFAP